MAMCISTLYRDRAAEVPDWQDPIEMGLVFGANPPEIEAEKFLISPFLIIQ